jgi:hypothetical protein
MTWSGFVAAYNSFDPNEFLAAFLMGSYFIAAVLGILVLYIKYSAPKPISDKLYPIASKTGFTLFFFFVISFLYWTLIIILFLFPINLNVARIFVPVGLVACCLITLFMTIVYEDSHWIVLNRTTFSQQEVSIEEGDSPIRFVNPASGVTQRLCLAPGSSYMEQLREPGAVVAPGQILHALFRTGDYEVIGVGNPEMVLRIHVHERRPWHEPGF